MIISGFVGHVSRRYFQLSVVVIITDRHSIRTFHRRKLQICCGNFISVCICNMFIDKSISGFVGYLRSAVDGAMACELNTFINLVAAETQICRLNFDDIDHTFEDIST